ncbi:MAG: protein-glutamate O-methyltransferase CheR [Micropepsaceae bacterium]
MTIRESSFLALINLLKQKSGLIITPDKLYLVESRLRPVADMLGFPNIAAFVDHLALAPSERAVQLTVEAMATHETSFFRDSVPFERLRDELLPTLLRARPTSSPLRFLCAACSSGQEPLSLAMLLDEQGILAGPRPVSIVAFDISDQILERAKTGLYSDFQVNRGLTPERIQRHFSKAGDTYRVQPKLMSRIDYRKVNILTGLSALGMFDVIFCRNVLIYFDDATKAQILNALSRLLPADGVLILGSSETALKESAVFVPERVGRGIFMKPQTPQAVVKPLQARA